MGQHDWYRKKSWGSRARKAFFERLNRSRSLSNKAQYVQIQALYLQQTGKEELVRASLELLDLLLEKWPDESILASAHLQRAECLEKLGDREGAIAAYRECVKAERENPGVIVGAGPEFGWFAVSRGLTEYYEEIAYAMEGSEENLLFPAEQFKFFAIIAIILDHVKPCEDSRRFAQRALDTARAKESGLRYHKKVGLVKNPDKEVLLKLKKIAKSGL
jgi:tetratricopeptide (TPR) repeat protein